MCKYILGNVLSSKEAHRSTRILVKKIPPPFTEEYIQMFFEYEKGQGGGAVKTVTLDSIERSAIVEFKSAQSVNIVLKKQPISIMGAVVDVEIYDTNLDVDESLVSANIIGLEEQLGLEIKTSFANESSVESFDHHTNTERVIQKYEENALILRKNNQDMKQMLRQKMHENELHCQTIKDLNDERDTMEERLQKEKSENKKLRQKKIELNKYIEGLKNVIEEETLENETQRKEIITLKKESGKVKKMLQAEKYETEKQTQQLSELNGENGRLKKMNVLEMYEKEKQWQKICELNGEIIRSETEKGQILISTFKGNKECLGKTYSDIKMFLQRHIAIDLVFLIAFSAAVLTGYGYISVFVMLCFIVGIWVTNEKVEYYSNKIRMLDSLDQQ